MNENIDLTKILKNCPEGTKFWSDNFGRVEFVAIERNLDRPIIVERSDGYNVSYTKEGWCNINFPASCLLWPSKDCRDWSKFTAPWYKKDKLVEPKFKAGDKIVNSIRKHMNTLGTQGIISEITDDKYIFTDGSYIFISDQDSWELFSDKEPKFNPKTLQPFDKIIARIDKYGFWCCELFSFIEEGTNLIKGCGAYYKYCVPYNNDTKHLIGTAGEAPDFYKYWED